MLHSCLVRVAFLLPTTHPHAMTPRSHSPYPPPQKKIKKNSEKGSTPTWMPPRGGGCPPPSMMPPVSRIIKAHTHATRQQYAARGMMHRQHTAHRQTQPVCVRNVHLHGNSPPPANQMPRKALTWHPQGKSNPPAGQNSPPEAAQGKPCIFFRFAYVYKYYLYNTRNKENKIFSPPHSRG